MKEQSVESSTDGEGDVQYAQLTDKLDPGDYTQYLGAWANNPEGDWPSDDLTLTEQDGQVEVSYTYVFSDSRINGSEGVVNFAPDGSATYDYEMDSYFLEPGTVQLQLREDGIEINETLFNRRLVED